LAPLPGVIVTAGPAGDGLADGEADALAVPPPGVLAPAVLPGDCAPVPPDRSMMVVVLPVHPVTASASAAAVIITGAAAEIAARIALISAPFPPSGTPNIRYFPTKTIHRRKPAVPVLAHFFQNGVAPG